VSLGKTKEMGWNRQHNVKTTQDKTASSSHPKNPGGDGTPPLQEGGNAENIENAPIGGVFKL
uniref:hypothetical protein n=1 Tax=Candidatus Scatomorpha intestinigallinarum TaxID=2840923 RepID=UPI004027F53E